MHRPQPLAPPALLPTRLLPSQWQQSAASSLSLARLDEFRDRLTSIVAYDTESRGIRAVHSSGGAAPSAAPSASSSSSRA